MLDKKISQTIDFLIKKIKDNNLGSIKLTNKVNSIEISNNSISTINNNTGDVSSAKNDNILSLTFSNPK